MAIAERVLERRRASRRPSKSIGFNALCYLSAIGLLLISVMLPVYLPPESLDWLMTRLE
ncbi:MAG: hypothetical protein ABSC26_07560 [Stellaceae bacterium]|jgi:hypothetical protein